jgi:hypothetical protein
MNKMSISTALNLAQMFLPIPAAIVAPVLMSSYDRRIKAAERAFDRAIIGLALVITWPVRAQITVWLAARKEAKYKAWRAKRDAESLLDEEESLIAYAAYL